MADFDPRGIVCLTSTTMGEDSTATDIGGAISNYYLADLVDLIGNDHIQLVSGYPIDNASIDVVGLGVDGSTIYTETISGASSVSIPSTHVFSHLLQVTNPQWNATDGYADMSINMPDLIVEQVTPAYSGTVVSGTQIDTSSTDSTQNTCSLVLAGDASSTDDYYTGMVCRVLSGTGQYRVGKVAKYIGSSRTAHIGYASGNNGMWGGSNPGLPALDSTSVIRISPGIYIPWNFNFDAFHRTFYKMSPSGTFYQKVFITYPYFNPTASAQIALIDDGGGRVTFALDPIINTNLSNGVGNNWTVSPPGLVFNSSVKQVPYLYTSFNRPGDTTNNAIGVWLKLVLGLGDTYLSITPKLELQPGTSIWPGFIELAGIDVDPPVVPVTSAIIEQSLTGNYVLLGRMMDTGGVRALDASIVTWDIGSSTLASMSGTGDPITLTAGDVLGDLTLTGTATGIPQSATVGIAALVPGIRYWVDYNSLPSGTISFAGGNKYPDPTPNPSTLVYRTHITPSDTAITLTDLNSSNPGIPIALGGNWVIGSFIYRGGNETPTIYPSFNLNLLVNGSIVNSAVCLGYSGPITYPNNGPYMGSSANTFLRTSLSSGDIITTTVDSTVNDSYRIDSGLWAFKDYHSGSISASCDFTRTIAYSEATLSNFSGSIISPVTVGGLANRAFVVNRSISSHDTYIGTYLFKIDVTWTVSSTAATNTVTVSFSSHDYPGFVFCSHVSSGSATFYGASLIDNISQCVISCSSMSSDGSATTLACSGTITVEQLSL